jgi:hypothetical protein
MDSLVGEMDNRMMGCADSAPPKLRTIAAARGDGNLTPCPRRRGDRRKRASRGVQVCLGTSRMSNEVITRSACPTARGRPEGIAQAPK